MREWAERFLTVTVDPVDARVAWLAETDPEAKQRLKRIHAASVLRCINRVLPDERPFWPDCDTTGWPQQGEYGGTPAHPLERWPELCRFAAEEQCSRLHQGDRHVADMHPLWLSWRERTKAAMVSYVIRTGDWEYPRNLVLAAHARERGAYASRHSDGLDLNTMVVLSWVRPDLLKYSR